MSEISVEELPKKYVEIDGFNLAYAALGSGEQVWFQHGNPTSSYLWRNIMPYVADTHQAIAPDLIGMGDSDKLSDSGPDRYTFVEHRDYLDKLLDVIMPEGPVILVIHDWGSALGFDWARRNSDRVKGICFMEGIVAPIEKWADFSPQATPVFQGFRSSAGEDMVLEKNIFVERVLPGSIIRDLSDQEMAVYRRPFLNAGEDRRPTLTWPRQIPIEGAPPDVTQIVSDYSAWLPETDFPKLFINAEPGAILLDKQREFVRSWKNVTEVTVKGTHFIQEDSPHEIGRALREWVAKLDR